MHIWLRRMGTLCHSFNSSKFRTGCSLLLLQLYKIYSNAPFPLSSHQCLKMPPLTLNGPQKRYLEGILTFTVSVPVQRWFPDVQFVSFILSNQMLPSFCYHSSSLSFFLHPQSSIFPLHLPLHLPPPCCMKTSIYTRRIDYCTLTLSGWTALIHHTHCAVCQQHQSIFHFHNREEKGGDGNRKKNNRLNKNRWKKE